MKITELKANYKKKVFEVKCGKDGTFLFPFSRVKQKPSLDNRIVELYADPELGKEAFTYKLENGKEDSIHMDQILSHFKDPDYLREQMLYKLTIQAQKILKSKGISKRELARGLHTSPAQLYRLLDQAFYGKTIDQMIRLLGLLDCPVDMRFKVAA